MDTRTRRRRRTSTPGQRRTANAQAKMRYNTDWRVRMTQLVHSRRTHARKQNALFTITPAEVLTMLEDNGRRCMRTGIQLRLQSTSQNHPSYNPWAPSIERVYPDMGYTLDNLEIVCFMYNTAKGRGSVPELLHFAQRLLSNNTEEIPENL